jgi:oligopeptide transport system substrate-binding protein
LSQDVRLREALNLAIDRELLVGKIYPLDEQPAYGVIPPVILDYTPQEMPLKALTQEARVMRAKALLAEAGYGPDHPLPITVSYPMQDNTTTILLAIRNLLKPVGIDLTLDARGFQDFGDPIVMRDFEVEILRNVYDYDDYETDLDFFRGDAAGNCCNYRSSSFDDLFHRGATATDIETRRALMQQADRQVLADFPLIPLYYGVLNRLVNPRLIGLPEHIDIPQSRYLSFTTVPTDQAAGASPPP